MPILAEPRRFLTVEDGDLLREAVEITCRALKIANKDDERKEITIRVSDLARSGLNSPQAIRDRIFYEMKALSDLAA